jgi:polar amino acid transport system substrate-binding protein
LDAGVGSLPGEVVLAILDEPPFCWLSNGDPLGAPLGCDVEVATTVLRRAGIGTVTVRQVTFADLIPGVVAGRWHVNTGMFVTPERAERVRFTRPIWAVPDGLIVRATDAGRFASYRDLATDRTARLAVVTGQVQAESAREQGVPDDRIVAYDTQDEAVDAVRAEIADAAASTALGNRALLARVPTETKLVAVNLTTPSGQVPLGAFSVSHRQPALADALDTELATFLGSPEHRALMTRYGFSAKDLDPALNRPLWT